MKCDEVRQQAGPAAAEPISEGLYRWGLALLLAYFGLRLVFLALSISSYVPPDEVTHAGLCKVFSRVLWMPENAPDTYQFGPVTNIPWLYYWVFGKLLHLNVFGLPDLVFLRLLNIPFAFGTVCYAVRLLRLLTEDRLTRLLLVAMFTNTAMFSFLSASVSYDNLTNMLAAGAIYYLFAFIRSRSGGALAACYLCQLLGALGKITFLPLILVLNVVLLVHELKAPRRFPAAIRDYFRAAPRRATVALLLVAVAFACNLKLYGGNYLSFGTPNPSMTAMLGESAAMNYRLEARGQIFNDFKYGKISYMDAVILAGQIQHPGDKADTFHLLMTYQALKNDPSLWMTPASYALFWFRNMTGTIMGIKGHLSMFKPQGGLLPVYLVMLLSLAGFLLRWRPRGSGLMVASLMLIVFFYSGYLMHEINYDAYLTYGEPSMTLFGRYLFPIMVPVFVLGSYYLLELCRERRIRLVLALATALLFVGYDFPWFLMHATPEWYSWLPN